MAKVQIADVIVPRIYAPAFLEETVRLDAFIQSGVVSNGVQGLTTGKGAKLFNMPFWADLTGDSEELSDSTALTPAKIGMSEDVCRLHSRGKAWSANDLAHQFSGSDPVQIFTSRQAKYWAGERQKVLINSLTGVFASASMAANVSDISGGVGAAAVIDFDKTVDAAARLGDHKEKLVAIAMHSAVEAKLAKDDAIEYETTSDKSDRVRTYMGKRVIVDDNMPVSSGTYTTYLFGEGAFGYQPMDMDPEEMLEQDRDILAGDDIVTSRHHFVLHPRGVKWTDTTVTGGITPSFANMALAANWTRVFDPKHVRIVQFKHNIA